MSVKELIDALNETRPSLQEFISGNRDIIDDKEKLRKIYEKTEYHYKYSGKLPSGSATELNLLKELKSSTNVKEIGIDLFRLTLNLRKRNDLFLFGDMSNDEPVGYCSISGEIVIYDEEKECISGYCAKDVSSFLSFLVQLNRVSVNYNYRNQNLSQADRDRLVDIAGGEKYRNTIEEFLLRFS